MFSLASLAVAPLARACTARLAPVVDQLDDQVAWRRGYCPVCGGPPLLGELRGVELRLFLRCAACGLAWPSRRLFCPVCESDNHHALHTLKVEGDQRFSAQLCDGCGAYLKIGNAFEPPPAELLALDDLASADLDVVAVERGYARRHDGFPPQPPIDTKRQLMQSIQSHGAGARGVNGRPQRPSHDRLQHSFRRAMNPATVRDSSTASGGLLQRGAATNCALRTAPPGVAAGWEEDRHLQAVSPQRRLGRGRTSPGSPEVRAPSYSSRRSSTSTPRTAGGTRRQPDPVGTSPGAFSAYSAISSASSVPSSGAPVVVSQPCSA